jgi:hypothetical protein
LWKSGSQILVEENGNRGQLLSLCLKVNQAAVERAFISQCLVVIEGNPLDWEGKDCLIQDIELEPRARARARRHCHSEAAPMCAWMDG